MTEPVDLHLLTGAYVVDALSPVERTAFETHLSSCPDCRREVAELAATAAHLGVAVSAPPPARLRRDVLARIASTPQEPTAT